MLNLVLQTNLLFSVKREEEEYAMKKVDQSISKWTRLAYQCYTLKGNCAQCDIPKFGLSTPCQVSGLLPKIIKKHGAPRKVHSKGKVVIVGEYDLGQAVSDTLHFKKAHHQAVLDAVIQSPGITSLALQQQLRLPKYAVHDALEIAFNLGLIQKKTLQIGSIRYKQWFYIGQGQRAL